MSHITDLHIQQFRGLRNVHLSEMGQINLLVGGNNSGKTSVLEAIATYCRPLDPWEWINAARSREIKSSRIPMLESFKWLFPQLTSNSANGLYQGQIVMDGKGDVPVREVVATLNEILVESMQENTSGYDDERFDDTSVIVRGAEVTVQAKVNTWQHSLFSNNGAMTETLTFQLREDERFVQRKKSNAPMLAVNTISSHAHRVEQLQMQRMSETALQELQSSAVEMLQSFDPGVESIEIWSQSGVRPTLYIRHRDFGLAPLSMFGDGMRRILLMATTIPLCKDGVLLIDELEIALHTLVLHTSFDWLVQSCIHNNIQLVATTHSQETVDALLEVCRQHEHLVVYRLEHESDQTTTTTLDKELLITLREELGQEVRW